MRRKPLEGATTTKSFKEKMPVKMPEEPKPEPKEKPKPQGNTIRLVKIRDRVPKLVKYTLRDIEIFEAIIEPDGTIKIKDKK